MNKTPCPRKTTRISEPINHRLGMYALAASAAGIGMLANPPASEAKVVYTPANIVLSGAPLPIDLNHDGINDFFLFHYGFHTTTGGNALLACLNPFNNGTRVVCASSTFGTNAANAFRVTKSNNGCASALVKGAVIRGANRFRSMHSANLGQIVFNGPSHSQPAWACPWVDSGKGVKNRYLGVKFKIEGKYHFGWARITVTTQGNSFSAKLTGYAYETKAFTPIVAGQTSGPDVITLPPMTLGHLARGATALPVLQKKSPTLAGKN